ncbi:MAG: glycosyltransferase family 2 protein [Chloroflexi bacterium]|nr:MAG: glycosyltransferase family 2 protein [Chloroflexota bacterium]
MKLSVIIPVYNEETTISEVIDKVRAVSLPLEKEIIVVDDGSNDHTADILKGREQDVTVVHYSRVNLGKGVAIRIGLTYVTGDIVIIQDADLELNPEEYQRLITPILNNETNVVYGSRFLHPANKIPRKTLWANKFLVWYTNLLYGSHLTDMETAYKVFRAEIIKNIPLTSHRFEIEPEITAKLLLLKQHIKEIPIEYNPRTPDEGKKIKWHDGILALWTLSKYRIQGFAVKPDGAMLSHRAY